jgi:hypothetical protein
MNSLVKRKTAGATCSPIVRSVARERGQYGERKTPERDKSGGRPPSEIVRDAADVC